MSEKIKEGAVAPDFTAPSSEGGTVSLNGLKGKTVVLYFYSKDDTPACTREANSFKSSLPKFAKLDAVVLGVSRDDLASHAAFKKKFGLNFPLLADVNGKIHEAYGALKERSMLAHTALSMDRSTFLIDPKGVIKKIWRDVKVDGHSEEVLTYLRNNPIKK
jgi:peroxiredoxin Q/BCP